LTQILVCFIIIIKVFYFKSNLFFAYVSVIVKSSSKIQHSNAMSNIHLYPDIEIAESNTNDTKYIGNTDEKSMTVTLDKKIKTELKDNRYIQVK